MIHDYIKINMDTFQYYSWSKCNISQYLFKTSNSNFESIKWMIPVFGILLSSGWLIAQWRILHYYCIYEKLVVSIENKMNALNYLIIPMKIFSIVQRTIKFQLLSATLYPFICIIFWIFDL